MKTNQQQKMMKKKKKYKRKRTRNRKRYSKKKYKKERKEEQIEKNRKMQELKNALFGVAGVGIPQSVNIDDLVNVRWKMSIIWNLKAKQLEQDK